MVDFTALTFTVLLTVIIILVYWVSKLRAAVKELAFGKQSLAVKYGKMSEQFMPFLKDYPYEPQNFRFLGTPVDGMRVRMGILV